ncbi:uncharacterized protein LOC127739765 [Arachis duranensis]|uniref:Uncharacterized protein LOC127739765 n=1 Tax=Arachis duranensis TaxID=130453 RepID=A0A9C6WEW4_ARADU|nr:uncharacterized protein LOC127739765 [Arachis duranensis]
MGNRADEADLGAVWKSVASGEGDNIRAKLDGVEGKEEREASYAPGEQNLAGKEIGRGAENCSNNIVEKNIPPSVVNEIHTSLNESGKHHVSICLMRGDAVQDSDLDDENTMVQEIGLDDEGAVRNLEDSEDSEQDADDETNQDEHGGSWDKDMAENRAAWDLTVKSGSILYDEDKDIMAILQAQNEVLTQKRRQAKQKEKARSAHTREEKLAVWKELSFLLEICQLPLCYMGVFNEVVQLEERKGASVLTTLSNWWI